MFLAPSPSGSVSVYASSDATDEEHNNVNVCVGLYSGADSSYSMYKSNCFDLMGSKCSVEWSSECDQYVNNLTSKQEASLFLQTIQANKLPLSSSASCRLQPHPFVSKERIVAGMNAFQTEDNTYLPTPCYQSDYLEHQRRSYEKQVEHKERHALRQKEAVLQHQQRLHKEKRIMASESPSMEVEERPRRMASSDPLYQKQFRSEQQHQDRLQRVVSTLSPASDSLSPSSSSESVPQDSSPISSSGSESSPSSSVSPSDSLYDASNSLALVSSSPSVTESSEVDNNSSEEFYKKLTDVTEGCEKLCSVPL